MFFVFVFVIVLFSFLVFFFFFFFGGGGGGVATFIHEGQDFSICLQGKNYRGIFSPQGEVGMPNFGWVLTDVKNLEQRGTYTAFEF